MKFNITVFLAICFLLMPAGVFAQGGLAGGAISITASEKGFFEPDTAELVLAVETAEKSVVLAAQENAVKAQALVDSLAAFVNEKGGDSIRTTRYTVQPVYEWDVNEKKNLLTGYMVTNQVLLKTHQTDKVGRIIDQAVTAGSNRMESLNFSLEKETAHCGGLIEKAAANAKQEAQALASSLGVKLGKIKSASPSCGPVSRTGLTGAFTLMSKKAAGSAKTPIEAGQTELQATVNIVFRIE